MHTLGDARAWLLPLCLWGVAKLASPSCLLRRLGHETKKVLGSQRDEHGHT